jgi:tRNA (guanine-N7-)-methyltransferase
MAKHKLRQFAEIESFKNVFHHLQHSENIQEFKLKGNWNSAYFNNSNPLVLELGCGKGEYSLGLAANHPKKNFIGIDLKGNRIWRGAKTALETNLKNVAFLRTRIENIESSFAPQEVDEIWITFPDPQPQIARIKKRLTSPRFLQHYKNILKPGGSIHLKTDSELLYRYTLEIIEEHKLILQQHSSDLYAELSSGTLEAQKNYPIETFSIQTFYEKKFSEKGFKICYIRFSL